MDEIEQLLEGGKAEAAAQKATTAQSPTNGHGGGSSDEVRCSRAHRHASSCSKLTVSQIRPCRYNRASRNEKGQRRLLHQMHRCSCDL